MQHPSTGLASPATSSSGNKVNGQMLLNGYTPLSEAIRSGRLAEFIAQEEARGVGSADPEAYNRALTKLIKAPQSEDQTSHSSSGDGSTET